jgi:hypothetical protein
MSTLSSSNQAPLLTAVILITTVTLLWAMPCFGTGVADLDGRINSWVSNNPGKHGHTDDSIHFASGAIVSGLTYWGLGKVDWFKDHIWYRRLAAGTFAISLRVLEESTNKHPDWEHDITYNVLGVGFAMAFTFDEVHDIFFTH